MKVNATAAFEAGLIKAVSVALNAIGATGAKEMKSHLDAMGTGNTGRLGNSIGYTTSTGETDASMLRIGKASQEDAVPRPEVPFAVQIGTTVYYGKYVNYGSLPHGQGDGSGGSDDGRDFWDRIREWVERKIGITGEDAEQVVKRIGFAIIKNGTDATPFFEPSFPAIEMATKAAVRDIAKRIGQEIDPVVVLVGPDGTQAKNTKQEATVRMNQQLAEGV